MDIVLYGIPHCDTVKKARAWLDERHLAYRFHDFKKQGVPTQRLAAWIEALGWEALVNRRGTTWRRLDAAAQQSLVDAASAVALVTQQPSLIRRPVVEWGPDVSVGFDALAWGRRHSA